MIDLHTSDLEKDIEKLINTFGVKKVSRKLQTLILGSSEIPDELLYTPAETKADIIRCLGRGNSINITVASLVKFANAFIIKRNKNKSDNILNARAEILYKHINTAHQPGRGVGRDDSGVNKSMENKIKNINLGIGKIRNGEDFPSSNGDRVGDHNKYKALISLLKSSEYNSHQPTIKLAFAMFGIIPSALEVAIREEDLQGEKEKYWQRTFPPHLIVLCKRIFLSKIMILWVVLGCSLLIGYYIYFKIQKRKDTEDWRRPRIKYSILFGEPHPLDSSFAVDIDSLVVSVEDITYEKTINGEDTVGVGKLWIRIKIRNLSRNRSYFLEGFYLKPKDPLSTYTGTPPDLPSASYKASPNLSIIITPKTGTMEWVVVNKKENAIPPLSEAGTLLEVVCGEKSSEPLMLTFDLIFELASHGKTKICKTEKPFQIAFDH